MFLLYPSASPITSTPYLYASGPVITFTSLAPTTCIRHPTKQFGTATKRNPTALYQVRIAFLASFTKPFFFILLQNITRKHTTLLFYYTLTSPDTTITCPHSTLPKRTIRFPHISYKNLSLPQPIAFFVTYTARLILTQDQFHTKHLTISQHHHLSLHFPSFP